MSEGVNKYTTLVNCVILTVDDEDTLYTKGRLVINDNKIHEIGDENSIKEKGEIVDMKGKLIMPGLINTHTHSPATIFRGLGDDLLLNDWLTTKMWPAEKHLDKEIAFHSSSLGYLEYLQRGMTTNVDMWYFADSVAEAAMSSGLRSVVAAGVFKWPSPESDCSLDKAIDFVSRYKGKEEQTRIYPILGPHDAYSTDAAILRDVAEFSKKNNLMIHVHLSETVRDNNEIIDQTGLTPTKHLESLGVFENRVLAAHGIYLSRGDMKVFRDSNSAVSYNPVSNLKLCDGILPYRELKENGVCVSLGVDGAQSNNSLDLLSDIKTGSLIQKMKENDPTFFPAREGVRMITIEGAKSIGMDNEIGSLEVGKKADIISLDLNDVNLSPFDIESNERLYSHVIYTATGHNVMDVWVDGEQLMSNKIELKVDSSEIISQANISANYIRNKAKL